jgi:molybdopterin/thiamine biosynthesis adenylyltransferase
MEKARRIMMSLDNTESEIYSRQITMKEIGERGQQTLANASVLVAGCGGLGAPVLYYLTAMGIGHLGLCDGDVVTPSNLNRQLLYTMEDLGKPKAKTAEKRLLALNPRLKTTVYDCFLDEDLAAITVPVYDIAVDCLDNYKSRFILNDACVMAGKPFVHAGIGEFYGQMMTVTPGEGPCLRCLFPDGDQKNEKTRQFGVIGATAGIIGSMQALEVAKYLLGQPINNKGLAVFDGLNTSLEKVTIMASPECMCMQKRHP